MSVVHTYFKNYLGICELVNYLAFCRNYAVNDFCLYISICSLYYTIVSIKCIV